MACNQCQKSRGLGDTVSNVIKKVSGGRIKECGGCAKRRKWLNDKVPYNNHAILNSLDRLKNSGAK